MYVCMCVGERGVHPVVCRVSCVVCRVSCMYLYCVLVLLHPTNPLVSHSCIRTYCRCGGGGLSDPSHCGGGRGRDGYVWTLPGERREK